MIEGVVSAIELLQGYRSQSRADQVRILGFLESLSEDARHLAEAWQDVLIAVQSAPKLDYYEYLARRYTFDQRYGEENRHFTHCYPPENDFVDAHVIQPLTNGTAYYRLAAFYSKIAFVLGENHKSLSDSLVGSLSELLFQRNLSKEVLEKGKQLGAIEVDNFSQMIEIVLKQSAELSIFIEEVKTRQI